MTMYMLVGWLVVYSVQSTGRSFRAAPPFTVPCEGREGLFLHRPTGNRTQGCREAVHYTSAALRQLHTMYRTCI